ncbi:hypothetical protein WG66_013319 [Moniliophthora roreri]|nr:hypothetical protein WG66_013319 [Moniliophthora roreri]
MNSPCCTGLSKTIRTAIERLPYEGRELNHGAPLSKQMSEKQLALLSESTFMPMPDTWSLAE